MSWSRPFDEPVVPPKGKALVTLKDAAEYIQKLPKAEQNHEEWQAAVEALLLVVELNGPTMMARVGIMRALNRVHVREAQVDLKDAANLRGGPYERYILIIHTDEFFLDSENVERFLVGSSFRTSMITDAILGLSYEPRLGRCPTFRLTIGTK